MRQLAQRVWISEMTQAAERLAGKMTHQTQFAGYYFAQARTSHLRETTSFELLEGGPGISPLERHSRRGVRLHGAEMSSCRIAWVR